MRYTAVFEWPDGQEPRVSKKNGWLDGELVAVQFSDALAELEQLKDAAPMLKDGHAELNYEALTKRAKQLAQTEAALMYPEGEARDKEEQRLGVKYFYEFTRKP